MASGTTSAHLANHAVFKKKANLGKACLKPFTVSLHGDNVGRYQPNGG
jgi:hypothetical protein